MKKNSENVCRYKNYYYLCTRNRETKDAQMAESVDALVSNTSGVTSIPVRPRVWVRVRRKLFNFLLFLFPLNLWVFPGLIRNRFPILLHHFLMLVIPQ